jgi:hypothetical protein
MSETSQLTGPLQKMFEQAGALCFRMQAGKIPIGRRWIHLCPNGTADLLVFPRIGPATWVECKDPAGSTKKSRREQQQAFRERVESLGHRYLLVKTIDEGLAALNG